MTAISVMRICRKKNIEIPNDISIIGFDDIRIAKDVEPPLTTMRARERSLAQKSVSVLLESITKEHLDLKVSILDTELVIRNSVKDINSV